MDSIVEFQITEGVRLELVAPADWVATEGSRTVVAAAEVLAGALATLAAKDKHYGGAWREQGWMGSLARIMSKTARLRQMLWAPLVLEDGEEPVRDTIQDLINLCVFMTLNLNARNRWGRGEN